MNQRVYMDLLYYCTHQFVGVKTKSLSKRTMGHTQYTYVHYLLYIVSPPPPSSSECLVAFFGLLGGKHTLLYTGQYRGCVVNIDVSKSPLAGVKIYEVESPSV